MEEGTVIAGSSNAFGTGAVSMFDGTTLGYANGVVINSQIGYSGAPGGVIRLDVASGALATQAGEVVGAAFGGSVVKTGAGTLVLTADNPFFAIDTVIAGGGLLVNGSIGGPILVDAAGLLGGNGTVGTTIVNGTLSPGMSIGTLRVDGDLTFNPTATYRVEIAGANSDLTIVTGAATLGGVVELSATPGALQVGTAYTILTGGSISGTFAGVDWPTFAFVAPELSYDPNSVFLTFAQVRDFASAGRTRNQIATAGGVESIGSGPLYNAVLFLPTVDEARAAFDMLSGEIHPSVHGAILDGSGMVRDAATARVRAALGDAGGGKTGAWAQALGTWGAVDSDGNAGALDYRLGGLMIGADALVSDAWRLGVLAAYTQASFDVDARASSASTDNFYAGIYSGAEWGAFGLRGGAVYGWHGIDTDRRVAFTGFTDALEASYDARSWQVFGEAGYKFDVGTLAIEPFVSAAHVGLSTDAFTESGGAAALAGASSDSSATFTTLGIRAATDFAVAGLNPRAQGMVGWRHAFGDLTPLQSLSFAGGDLFVIAGVPIAQDALRLEAGLDFAIGPAARLGVGYVGEFADGRSASGLKASFAASF